MFIANGGQHSEAGGPATRAELNLPVAVAVDRAGNLLVADMFNQRIRVVPAATGTFTGRP